MNRAEVDRRTEIDGGAELRRGEAMAAGGHRRSEGRFGPGLARTSSGTGGGGKGRGCAARGAANRGTAARMAGVDADSGTELELGSA